MPAQNTDIPLRAKTWVLLTSSNVTAFRVKEKCGFPVKLKATVGEVPPTNDAGSVDLLGYEGMAADVTLAQLFPGVTGANRVYGYAEFSTVVSVSHA
jgi:hypothetical protein